MYEYLSIGHATDITDPHERRLYRFLEIIPGALAWITLILVVVLSFITPVAMALFIIVFDIYWLIKTIFLSLLTRSSFTRMRRNLKEDWHAKLEHIMPKAPELTGSAWHDIYHLIVLPMAYEPLTIVRESFQSLLRSKHPRDTMIVVLAIEERAGQSAQDIAQAIKQEFGHEFFKFLITQHPADLPGEIPGKGSNEAWAGKRVKEEIIDPLGIPYNRIVVSVFDVDTVVPHDFFGCLTWHYLTAEKPLRSSFQPIPLFTNNIWEAPAFARVFAFSTTFWQMIQQARPEQLVTFSSQSISFQALIDVGFWQGNMVSEDSRIFWQCLLRYDGDWRTIPLYYPVYMDANVAPTFLQTIKNQYKQIRRWHYGAENNPYFMYGFLKNKKIPLATKIQHTFIATERTHSSPTNALIIFLLGWLPIMVGGPAFSSSILSYNLPHVTTFIMNLAMFGLVTSALLTIMLVPPRPPHYGRFQWIFMALQWLLFPINFILFGAIPALDAQTRLMFGKYLGFWVTPKDRITQSE